VTTPKRTKNNSPPALSSSITSDEEALSLAINAILLKNPTYGRSTKQLLRRQRELRAVLDDEQWDSYLALEAVVNERFADAMLALVRWALSEGRQSRTR
jgi:hypothetical protein